MNELRVIKIIILLRENSKKLGNSQRRIMEFNWFGNTDPYFDP